MSVTIRTVALDGRGGVVERMRDKVTVGNGDTNVALTIGKKVIIMDPRDAVTIGSALLNAAMNAVEGEHGEMPGTVYDDDDRAIAALSDERVHQ